MKGHLPLYLVVVAIEKGAFRWLSTKVSNFTFFIANEWVHLEQF